MKILWFFRLLIVVTSGVCLALERSSLLDDLFLAPHIAALIALGVLVRLEFKYRPVHVLATFFQSFYFLGMLVSSLLITAGLPMIEIGEVGDPNGTFWVLVIFFVVGAWASSLGFNIEMPIEAGRRRLGKRFEQYFVLGLIFFVVASSLLVVLLFSNPYSLGIDRVVYWDTVVPGYLSWVNSAVRQTILFPILLYYASKAEGKRAGLATVFLLAYLVITVIMLGEKASAFILYTSIWLLVLGAFKGGGVRLDRRAFITLIFGLLCIYGLLSYNYRVADYGDAFIITRIAMQAQVLWSALHTADFPFLNQVQPGCFWGCEPASSAADYVSIKYLPSYLYAIYADSGSTLSGFLPGLAILSFGFAGALLLHGLVSFILGFVARRLVEQFRKNNVIFSFLIFKIYFAIILYWYAAIHTAVHSAIFAFTVFLVLFISAIGGGRRRNFRLQGGLVVNSSNS